MGLNSSCEKRNGGGAFTIPEVLVVIGVIAVLLAVLLPALTSGMRTADMASSQSNMRQIAIWMNQYSSENREYIVPSQFDYTASAASGYPVKVRSNAALGAWQYRGTWSDILWTYAGLGVGAGLRDPGDPANATKYEFDSPDRAVFESVPDYENPLRSAAPNTTDFTLPGGGPGSGPTPYGTGATEAGLPGYFAANNFFYTGVDNRTWFTTGQLRAPDKSMYLVDSLAGETIEPIESAYDNNPPAAGSNPPVQVDFRYSGSCLMMFLDGSISVEAPWYTIWDIEGCFDGAEVRPGRSIRIRDLTNKNPYQSCP